MKQGLNFRKSVLVGVILVLLAAMPVVASADEVDAFNASGELSQTGSGTVSIAPQVGIPGLPDVPSVLGVLATGQIFEGTLVLSNWEDLMGAQVNVNQ